MKITLNDEFLRTTVLLSFWPILHLYFTPTPSTQIEIQETLVRQLHHLLPTSR